MTVSAGIQATAGGHPVLSMVQAKASGKAPGTAWAGSAQASSSSTAGGVRESFLSNLQAQLASWGSGLDGLGALKAESDGANEIEDAADAPTHQPAPSASRAGAPVSPWPALPSKTGMPQPSSQASRMPVTSPASLVATAVPWLSVQMPRQNAPSLPVLIASPSKTSQSSADISEHPTSPSKVAKSVWGAEPPRQISIAAMIPPAAFAVPILTTPIKNSTIVHPESPREPSDSAPTAGHSVNELNDTLAAKTGSAQVPDRPAIAQIQVPEQTQSRDASPSVWPGAKPASAQSSETNDLARTPPETRIAPAMSAVTVPAAESVVQERATTTSPQAEPSIPNARITSIPADVGASDSQAVRTQTSTDPLSSASKSPLSSTSSVVETTNPTASRVQLPAGIPTPNAYSTVPNATKMVFGANLPVETPKAQNLSKPIPSIQPGNPVPQADGATAIARTAQVNVHETAVQTPHPEGPEEVSTGPNAPGKQEQEPASPLRSVAQYPATAASPASRTELKPESRFQSEAGSGTELNGKPAVAVTNQPAASRFGEPAPSTREPVTADATTPALVSIPAPAGTQADATPTSQSAVNPQATPPEEQKSSLPGSVLPALGQASIPPSTIGGAQQGLQAHPPVAPTTAVGVAYPVPENPASTIVRPEADQSGQKSIRGAVTDNRRSLSNQIGPAAAAVEPSPVVHVPAAVASAVPAIANPGSGHAQTSVQITPREAFAALDAEAAPGKPTWTHSTPQQAEAGFQDPVLGWVGVRADMSGGGVHAALLPGSPQAAQDLGKHMDGINSYLAEQHTPVDSLVMAAPVARTDNASASESSRHGMQQGFGQGTDQGTNQGNGQQTQQQAYTEPDSNISLRMTSVDGPGPTRTSAATVEADGQGQSSRGTHISVVA